MRWRLQSAHRCDAGPGRVTTDRLQTYIVAVVENGLIVQVILLTVQELDTNSVIIVLGASSALLARTPPIVWVIKVSRR